MSQKPEIVNRLPLLRQKRGLAAAQLAEMAGVSRQTIYAMEAGSYIPNTAVALKLARALEVKVEELFSLPEKAPEPDSHLEQALLLPGAGSLEEGQPVQLGRVDDRLVASPPAPFPWYFPASDGVLASPMPGRGKARLRIFDSERQFRNRLLIAGCDPAISLVARHLAAGGVELVLVHRNSSQALGLLKDRFIHVAGTHLRDETSGESNLPAIARMFPRHSVAVITFAVWEEGVVTARGNPKQIRGVEDLARADIRTVNRESGAGARKLLDAHLKRLKIPSSEVRGYGVEAPGHLPAARRVETGEADACISTRAAARMFGLGFVPLASERYDLAIRRQHLELPAIRALLDVLNQAQFRRQLDGLGGYDTTPAGQRVL